MRIRTVKPEWLDDERLACASDAARTMSIALILLADDHGRGRASVTMLGGRIFPAHANPREHAAKAREELRTVRFVTIYEHDGQEYYQIRNWARHQRVDRPSASQLPPPPPEKSDKPLENNAPANIREDASNDREDEPSARDSLATDLDLDHGRDQDRGGEGNAGAPATPTRPRRRDVHDYAGAPADAAQAALSAARVAAGGAPVPRGGFQTQQAWSQVACDADELSEALGRPVGDVLAMSAKGFVAERGVKGSPVWWAERFGDYYQAGVSGRWARKVGEMHPLPPESAYKPTTDEELDAMFGPETAA